MDSLIFRFLLFEMNIWACIFFLIIFFGRTVFFSPRRHFSVPFSHFEFRIVAKLKKFISFWVSASFLLSFVHIVKFLRYFFSVQSRCMPHAFSVYGNLSRLFELQTLYRSPIDEKKKKYLRYENKQKQLCTIFVSEFE